MLTDPATAFSSLQMQLEAHRPDPSGDRRVAATTATTPVCLLTGFLGSGKSTLLAALLSSPPGGLVVRAVVNDVGKLPFDPTLLAAADGVRIELTNGCGCCVGTADLAATLAELGAEPGIDLVVLEASGVADPLALAQLIEAEPTLELDRIVTVVGGPSLIGEPSTLGYRAIFDRQLDSAHCVVVSDLDLLRSDLVDRAVARASAKAPGRVVARSSIDTPAVGVLTPGTARGARPIPLDAGATHHAPAVRTVDQHLAISRVDLERALARSRPEVLRVKLGVSLDGCRHFVQMTPASIKIVAAPDAPAGLTVVAVDQQGRRPSARSDRARLTGLTGIERGVTGARKEGPSRCSNIANVAFGERSRPPSAIRRKYNANDFVVVRRGVGIRACQVGRVRCRRRRFGCRRR